MDDKKSLYDDSQDAFFAYLMDEISDDIGEQAKRDRNELNSSEEFKPSAELDGEIHKKINKGFRVRKRRGHTVKRIVRTGILVAVIAVLLSITVSAAVPEWRRDYLTTALDMRGNEVVWHFEVADKASISYRVEVPPDFHLLNTFTSKDDEGSREETSRYIDKEEHELTINVKHGIRAEAHSPVDGYYFPIIDTNSGVYFEFNGSRFVVMSIKEEQILVSIETDAPLTQEDMIRIARSFQILKTAQA